MRDTPLGLRKLGKVCNSLLTRVGHEAINKLVFSPTLHLHPFQSSTASLPLLLFTPLLSIHWLFPSWLLQWRQWNDCSYFPKFCMFINGTGTWHSETLVVFLPRSLPPECCTSGSLVDVDVDQYAQGHTVSTTNCRSSSKRSSIGGKETGEESLKCWEWGDAPFQLSHVWKLSRDSNCFLFIAVLMQFDFNCCCFLIRSYLSHLFLL